MIINLFVDIDDTLILDNDEPIGSMHPFMYYEENFTPNIDLIINLIKFHRGSPDTKIYLWSGGGSEYVGIVAAHVLPRFMNYECIDKSPAIQQIVKEGDIFIDDSGHVVKSVLGDKALDFNDETHKFFYRIVTADQFGTFKTVISLLLSLFLYNTLMLFSLQT